VYLAKDVRNRLFSRAYIASGRSLRKIGEMLGYVGKGRHGHIRDMWLGRQPIARKHLEKLASLARTDMTEILASVVDKQSNEKQEDWRQPHGTHSWKASVSKLELISR